MVKICKNCKKRLKIALIKLQQKYKLTFCRLKIAKIALKIVRNCMKNFKKLRKFAKFAKKANLSQNCNNCKIKYALFESVLCETCLYA